MGFADSRCESDVGNVALGRCGDVVRARSRREESVLKTSNKLIIVGEEIVGERSGVDESLNIQIKTINRSIAKGTRLSGVDPCRGTWSKSTPQELSKILCDSRGWQGVVDRIASSYRKQDLLAIGLAFLNSRTNTRTARQKSTLGSIRLCESSIAASVSKVR